MWNLPDIWISWITRYLIICIEGLRMMIWMIPLHMTTRWRYSVNDRILDTWCHKWSAIKISRINHNDVFQISFRSKGRICLFRKKIQSDSRDIKPNLVLSKMVIFSDIKWISQKNHRRNCINFHHLLEMSHRVMTHQGALFPFLNIFLFQTWTFSKIKKKTFFEKLIWEKEKNWRWQDWNSLWMDWNY